MRLASARLLNAGLGALLVSAVAAACGSSDEHKNVRSAGAGAGGEAGQRVVPASGGDGVQSEAGNGGVPIALGGAGGEPAVVNGGEGGAPVVAMGGVPAIGAAGVPTTGNGGEAGAPEPPLDCTTISLQDSKLRDAVLAELDSAGPLTTDDIAELTTLDARGYGVSSVAGLECFQELTQVDFGIGGAAATISDVTPLSRLKKLTYVRLDYNPVTSLEGLGKLPNLTTLDLNGVPNLLDLAPLATSPQLAELNLKSDKLATLSPLAAVTTLTSLDLTNVTLTDKASISGLTSLQELEAPGIFTNASSLSGLTKLTNLSLRGAILTNVTALESLVNLTVLDVGQTDITDIAFVAPMVKLVDLNAFGNQIVDISALSGLAQLQHVNLVSNKVQDISPLSGNLGIATGDEIDLNGNLLNCTNEQTYITTMKGRGASVYSDCP